MDSHLPFQGTTLGASGLSGSLFHLSARAAPFDPGEPDGCIYPLLGRR